MAAYTVYFNSSAGGYYSVQVEWDDQQINALRCDCPAGSFSQLCKHLKAFFEFNASFLHRPDQHDTFRSIRGRLQRSPLNDDYNRLLSDIRHCDDMEVTAKLKGAFVEKLSG